MMGTITKNPGVMDQMAQSGQPAGKVPWWQRPC